MLFVKIFTDESFEIFSHSLYTYIVSCSQCSNNVQQYSYITVTKFKDTSHTHTRAIIIHQCKAESTLLHFDRNSNSVPHNTNMLHMHFSTNFKYIHIHIITNNSTLRHANYFESMESRTTLKTP